MVRRQADRASNSDGIPHARTTGRPPHHPVPERPLHALAGAIAYAATMLALTVGTLVMLKHLDSR